MHSFDDLRRMMVDCQLRTYDVTNRAVLAAADAVPREAFLPEQARHLAYLDQPVPLAGTGRALVAPMVVARMVQTLLPAAGERALDYGGGSGYGAALMAAMGARATLWEPDAAALVLARAAQALPGVPPVRLLGERPAGETFDAILVGGACEELPEPVMAMLAPGGRLVVVLGIGRSARVMLYTRAGEGATGRPVFDAAAPALQEFRRAPAFAF